jgi:hypothetical protein
MVKEKLLNVVSFRSWRTEGYLRFVKKPGLIAIFSCQNQSKIFLRKILQFGGSGAIIVASKPSLKFNYQFTNQL